MTIIRSTRSLLSTPHRWSCAADALITYNHRPGGERLVAISIRSFSSSNSSSSSSILTHHHHHHHAANNNTTPLPLRGSSRKTHHHLRQQQQQQQQRAFHHHTKEILRTAITAHNLLHPTIRVQYFGTKAAVPSEAEVLYEGPMGKLITSLKVFSLSSAALSIVGLPSILLWKGIDIFSGVHLMMVGTTICGSVGSTVGLHYIFAPYVYHLERIPIRQCHYDDKKQNETESNEEGRENKNGDKGEENVESTTNQDGSTLHSTTTNTDFLLKATTRSIFAMRVEHVFDPSTDIAPVPSGTIRPFCSFIVKHQPLYIHEQMIDDPKLYQALFLQHAKPIPKAKNPDPDDEFL